jgi:hypothetical protein
MASPSRPIPVEGMPAEVQYLSEQVGAVVVSVTDAGRRLIVVTDDGERVEFLLRRSTGKFHAVDDRCRLKLLPFNPVA